MNRKERKKGKKMKILFIDDEINILKSYKRIITSSEIDADFVDNPSNFYEYLNSDNYDLVIMDIAMKDINGLDLLSEMKDKGIDLKVILLTGLKDSAIQQIGKDLGAIEILEKPISREMLLKTINKYREK